MKTKTKAFTLVEMMIVIAIIGVLATLAYPAMVQARITSQMNACIENMRIIDGAKTQYGFDYGYAPSAFTDVTPYFIKKTPICPAGGSYVIGPTLSSPTCSISGGHTL